MGVRRDGLAVGAAVACRAMNLDPELDQRLARIEAHLVHVERMNEELNGVVIEQARVIAKLQTQLRRVGESLENAERDRIQATNPKPPHYQ